ncbi:hypothetical protein C7974DRAFT_381579 [Boeremia exigua]|uniref:uncharacterized protein n=1 Tax=Boeremia exigua TaxID=749465 RepID=UPI001E8E6769|nr:uncharacterized protein C7974DRAFT_381579 [Boeremia exigua]KAH6612149.1 hypothetical protein C7974DRAFT_381579 [Boeremia exigua]
MDPFSITASIITLLQVSAQVTVLVRQFRDEVSVVDATLNGILNDVDGFQQVLQSMKETLAQEDIQADVQATGHVGSHWKNLARSLSDGESTLDQLRSLLTSVNKSTSFLDASRKQLRMKSAVAQISGFREQIQSYRAALQLSLSTIIVWNQVTLQKATTKLPEKIMPNLNKLYDQIRTLGADLNAKIGKLESTVANQGFHAESELMSMTNLKECVESAADVVSTASTTLGPEGSTRASVKYGSDFGDVFKKESNEPMQRWMSSHTVYEFDDVEALTLDPSEASTGDTFTVYESESDSDIEHELVRALFNNGKKRKEQGDLHGAERHLRNCLSRFPSAGSYTSLASSQSTLATAVSKAELLELLTETYCMQGSWDQAKSTMKEKLAITERQTGKKSERFLWDSFRLCEVLMNTKDYTEAQLHGRQALRGFRKLREPGYTGYEKTLALLIQICNEQGSLEDEEAYAALLGSHHANLKTFISLPVAESAAKHDLSSQPPKGEHHVHTREQTEERSSTQDSSGPASSELPPIDKGKQPRLQGLTKIPPLTDRNDELPLSPSSSASADPWSPKLPAARSRNNDSSSSQSISNIATKASSSQLPEFVPKSAMAHENIVSPVKFGGGVDTSSSTKLLISLCQQELGQKPIFMIGRGREGYNCIVFADESRKREIAKVADYLTKEEARHAAATKAYKTLVTLSSQPVGARPANDHPGVRHQHERSSSASNKSPDATATDAQGDPPAYTPSESPRLTSPTGFLQDIPEIMVSPSLNDSTFGRPMPSSAVQNSNFPVRRAASDSHLPSNKVLANVSASNAVNLGASDWRGPNAALTANSLPAHRRAASTSSRVPDWRTGDGRVLPQHSGLAINTSNWTEPNNPGQSRKESNARPNVTFDSIESSVERPKHSNPDPHTPSSKGFSLLPASLAKTFSLQERRSKSDDPSLRTKKSMRFGLSSKRKSHTSASAGPEPAVSSTSICPICSASLLGLSEGEAWMHVDSCLGGSSPSTTHVAYELPASEPNTYAVELPASVPGMGRADGPASPNPSSQSPNAMSDLHRAFSRRDLSADKFEIEDEARIDPPAPMSPLSRFETNAMQRQVLLLGDGQCGKTWLSHAWCKGTIPKRTSPSATSFTKRMDSLEIVIQDYSAMYRVPDQERRASYGVVHAVLLCFDISSPETFENVEHKVGGIEVLSLFLQLTPSSGTTRRTCT